MLLAVTSSLHAVTDEDVYRGLRMTRLPSGGRAAGMGGASLALNDDAGASSANPARLAALTDRQAMLEGRMMDFDETSNGSDRIRFDPMINPFAGTTFEAASSPDAPATPALLAYAHPLPLATPLVLGVSRVELLDVSVSARATNTTTPVEAPVTPSGGDEILRVSRGNLDAGIHLYNLAAGWRPLPGFSIGGAIVVGRMSLSSRTTGFLRDPLQFTGPGMIDPRFSGPQASPLVETTADGSDTAPGFSFGATWRPHPALALATTHHAGPRFEIQGRSRDFVSGRAERFDNVVKIPDVSAAGVAWTPFVGQPSARLQSLTLALDIVRTEHSDLLEGFREAENVMTREDFVQRVAYTADDAVDARLGAEIRQSFPSWTLALRGGVYTEHDGRIRLDDISGDLEPLTGQSRALEEGDFFSRDDTRLHGTLGAGAIFYHLSFDAAIDLSNDASQVVVSATYRFR